MEDSEWMGWYVYLILYLCFQFPTYKQAEWKLMMYTFQVPSMHASSYQMLLSIGSITPLQLNVIISLSPNLTISFRSLRHAWNRRFHPILSAVNNITYRFLIRRDISWCFPAPIPCAERYAMQRHAINATKPIKTNACALNQIFLHQSVLLWQDPFPGIES